MSSYPTAITPVHGMKDANASIPLYEGRIQVLSSESAGISFDPPPLGTGTIHLRFVPGPGLKYNIDISAQAELGLEAYQSELVDLEAGGAVVAHRVYKLSGDSSTSAVKEVSLGSSPDLAKVVFHVLNFHKYIGEPISSADGNRVWTGRWELGWQDWRITLDIVPAAIGQDGLFEQLNAQGGFAVTHVGLLEKVDGTTFSSDQAKDLLLAIHYFLSFSRGFWSPVILPYGYAPDSEIAWRHWVSPVATAWNSRSSWFVRRRPLDQAALSQLFTGFCDKWFAADWREPLYTMLHWYIEANTHTNPETSVILSNVGLDLASWSALAFPGSEKVAVSTIADFERVRSAEERISKLLAELRIPDAVPASLEHLVAFAAGEGVASGVTAITRLRNKMVHPTPDNRRKAARMDNNARFQAAQLALWFFELSLLHLFGYDGLYTSRLRREEERVPWGQSQGTS